MAQDIIRFSQSQSKNLSRMGKKKFAKNLSNLSRKETIKIFLSTPSRMRRIWRETEG